MVKLNYVLMKNEGNEWKKYIPKDYPTSLDPLTCLQGPNSSGKSTIMNIIALGLFAHRQDSADIEPALRSKVDTLLDTDHHKLTFELEIEIPGKAYSIVSRKTNSESDAINMFKVENGRETPFTFENFQREFRLIYSIPNDPTIQLRKLTDTIKLTQQDLQMLISALRSFFKNKIDSIQASRDESVLAQLVKEKDDYSCNAFQIEKDMASTNAFRKKLYQYHLVRTYIKTDQSILENWRAKSDLLVELSKIDKNEKKLFREQAKFEKLFSELIGTAQSKRSSAMIAVQNLVGPIIDEGVENLKRASLLTEINNPDIQHSIRNYLDTLIKAKVGFRDHLRSENHDNLKLKELYSTLLRALDNVSFNNLSVPGSNTTVENFRNEIGKAMDDLSKKLSIIDEITDAISIVSDYRLSIEAAIKCRRQLSLQSGGTQDTSRSEDEIKQEIQQIENNLQQAEALKTKISEKMVQERLDIIRVQEIYSGLESDDDLASHRNLTPQGIKQQLDQLTDSLNKQREKLLSVKALVEDKNRKILIMEQLESDPDRPYLSKLRVIDQKIYTLLRKFQYQFPQSLTRIEKHAPLEENDKLYAKGIGEFYARKMKTLLYNEETLQVKFVNIIKSEIITEDDRIIRFGDLSTGQSQSTYLSTKLSMAGEKKVIALFDEVASMDSISIGQVKDKIRSLFQKGNLVMALIVQMADDVKTNSFVLRDNQDE